MVEINVCIHAPNINGNPLSASAMEMLLDHGLKHMRMYGSQSSKEIDTLKKFAIFKFDMTNWDDIEHLDAALHEFEPVYCFREECPKGNYGCPAFRPS